MTASIRNKKRLNAVITIIVFILALVLGEYLKDGAIYGIKLCAFNIIPTLFPFFVLADLCRANLYVDKRSYLGRLFERIFKINASGFSAFLLGNICGFPLGIKTATKQYNDGLLNQSDLNALSVIANNPSPAFVILGVGKGMFSSSALGTIFYFSTMLSSIIIGIIFKPKSIVSVNTNDKIRQKFNLISSIKDAATSSILVSSYIIFFSSLVFALGKLIKNPIFLCLVASLFEVGSACNIIVENRSSFGSFFPCFISFALGFSGISVFLQAFSFLPRCISKKHYLFKKLLQGVISVIITAILISI